MIYEIAIKYRLSTYKNFLFLDREKAIEKYNEIKEEINKLDILERRYYGLYLYERKEGSDELKTFNIEE